MRSTFKILFYVKKGSEKPNGNLPLMCRLTVDGEVKQFSCKMDVPPRLWDVKNGRATGKSLEAQKINAAVDRCPQIPLHQDERRCLGDIFELNRNTEAIELMREDVEPYEEAVRKQATLAEQARLKEQAAKEQESKAKSIKDKK